MIKIKTNNWEALENMHKSWYKEYILPELKVRYNLLDKGMKNSKGIVIYKKLLNKIIQLGSDYCVQKNLFLDMSSTEVKILRKLLKKNGKESLLEKILERRVSKIMSKTMFSKLIQDMRKYNISCEAAIERLKKELSCYSNVNIEGICSLVKFESFNSNLILNIREGKKMIYDIKQFHISDIFDYDKTFASREREKITMWGRHTLLAKMGIEVCPYCQRNYITSYTDDDSIDREFAKTTADLDHYYSKSNYPYLALSLYNFIPSCQICNSRFKGDKETYESTLYPYESCFEDEGAKFEISEGLISSILDNNNKFYIKINDNNSVKVKNSIKMFKLDKVYKTSHNNYVKGILENLEKRPDLYIESIADDFFEKENDISKQKIKDLFKELVKEPYRHKIANDEPLSKLTKDIFDFYNIEI